MKSKEKKSIKKTNGSKKNGRGTRATHGWHPNCFFLNFQKKQSVVHPCFFYIKKQIRNVSNDSRLASPYILIIVVYKKIEKQYFFTSNLC